MKRANLAEVFSSIQGEGPYLGCRALFIRFAGCNLRCAYCDTRDALEPKKTFPAEREPAQGRFRFFRNPISASRLLEICKSLDTPRGLHDALTVTGGEPLLQAEFLQGFLPQARKVFRNIYLETNGTLPEALETILPYLDIIAMDVKLKSTTGEKVPLRTHRRFLRLARRVKVFVKVVLTDSVKMEEIAKAARMVASVGKDLLVVLQPAGRGGPSKPPNPDDLLVAEMTCRSLLKNVRLIPQIQNILNLP